MTPPPREAAVYRPFALLAFGAAVIGGVPLGLRLLAWLYLGAPAVSAEWVLLHAHLQVFGFFATLIVGVAPHLFARFTGRAIAAAPLDRVLAGLLGGALVLRVVGTWVEAGAMLLLGAALQTVAFALFTRRVWRALDAPPLAVVRRQLTVSTAWLALALLVETAARGHALLDGRAVPALATMRAVHAVALAAGVLGWVLGVLLRAGPMFVAGWQVPPLVARLLPVVLGAGALASAAGAQAGHVGLARTGDAIAVGGGAIMLITAGAFRHVPKALPMLSRSAVEARTARIALVSLPAAALASVALAAAAMLGTEIHVATDAVRHLVAVGFVTAIVIAMTFRLIPVLEQVPLTWPRLRHVAFVALAGAVLLRTAQVLVPHAPWFAPAIALSGALVWLALAAVSVNLAAAMRAATRHAPRG